MIELKRAEVRTEDGHQVIVLPEDIHIDEAEVYVERNPDTGEITVMRERPNGRRRPRWSFSSSSTRSISRRKTSMHGWSIAL